MPGTAQFDDAWCCIREAGNLSETTKYKLWEAEVRRIAGEIALKSPEKDAEKAEAYFDRALGHFAPPASQIMGVARRDEHGAALARSGQAG
jgi:hypothetical protein